MLRHARARVRDRENLRLERTRLFGRVRRIFVEIGRRLHALDILDDPRDVFYLEVDEVLGFVEGRSTTTNLRGLVGAAAARSSPDMRTAAAAGRRFETRGAVYHGHDFHRRRRPAANADGDERQGIGCCPGIVPRTGARRRAIRATSDLGQRAILVAEHTDPGWIMLFPVGAGRARRARQPAVARGDRRARAGHPRRRVGPGRHPWLKDGDWVEFDGSTGIVRHQSASSGRASACAVKPPRAPISARIRYAQVWEDADVLLEALDVQPGHVCVSIASAGDNALALLTQQPARVVVALDLSPAQLACLELRVAAYRDARRTPSCSS